jgi:hypothetical protein
MLGPRTTTVTASGTAFAQNNTTTTLDPDSKTVNIGSGISTIALNFDVPVGVDLRLMTDTAINLQSFNTYGPRLRRSDVNVKYPYEIPNVVTLKNSNFDASRYYYFFAWDIDFYSNDCVSDRIPVIALVKDSTNSTPQEPAFAAGLRLFPNPTSGALNIQVEDFAGGDFSVSISNALGATLHAQHRFFPAGKMVWEADLSGFASGLYWVELATEAGTVRRKVVVE